MNGKNKAGIVFSVLSFLILAVVVILFVSLLVDVFANPPEGNDFGEALGYGLAIVFVYIIYFVIGGIGCLVALLFGIIARILYVSSGEKNRGVAVTSLLALLLPIAVPILSLLVLRLIGS